VNRFAAHDVGAIHGRRLDPASRVAPVAIAPVAVVARLSAFETGVSARGVVASVGGAREREQGDSAEDREQRPGREAHQFSPP
jgi:hypothetical protein